MRKNIQQQNHCHTKIPNIHHQAQYQIESDQNIGGVVLQGFEFRNNGQGENIKICMGLS